ncbi:MAG TPA: MFS transporter [Pyrinomonadaceae bacterium]|jgi:MFS family permease|nr:MFS transporter [Pyrinomonadaceae bacterium]
MGDTDTDAGDRFGVPAAGGEARRKLDEGTPGLWHRYRRLPRNVFAISLVSLLNDASSESIYPFLPLFLTMLGVSPFVIGVIEGASESVSGLLKLFAGYWSDRRGRRKGLVVSGYALSSVARPLLAFAQSWWNVLFIRLTDRVGKGIRSAPRDAMIADAALPAERGIAFGFHRAMDHAGAVVGPLLGFAILAVIAATPSAPTIGDYRTVFLLASIPALLAMIVAVFAVRETRREERTETSAPMRLSLRGFDGNFKRFLVIIALFTLSNSTDAFLLKRASDIGVSAATIPLLWAALHAVKVLSSLVGGDLSDRLGRKRLIASGWILYAVVYGGFAFVSSVGEVWVLFLIYGVYFGLAEGAEKALVADLVRPEQRGTAYGLYNLAFTITVLPASLLLGALWNWRGATTAFLVSAVLGASAALLLLLTVKSRDELEHSGATQTI